MKTASHYDFPTFSNKPDTLGLGLDSEGSVTANVKSVLLLDVCSCVLEAALSDMSLAKVQRPMPTLSVNTDVVAAHGSC